MNYSLMEKTILYNSLNPSIEAAEMFGFIKNNDGTGNGIK